MARAQGWGGLGLGLAVLLGAACAPADDSTTVGDVRPRDDGGVVETVDDDGTPLGTAPRTTVHTTDTPLHQAFSLYLFDDEGRVLITRRALGKVTWAGVWTACR